MAEVDATLAERGTYYGDWRDNARIADNLTRVMEAEDNWRKMPPYMRQALLVIAQKMARALNGDPYHLDNWHDIQGYAKLVEERAAADRATFEQDRIRAAVMRPEDDYRGPRC